MHRNASQPSLANLRFLDWARETASPLGLNDSLSLLSVSVLNAGKTLPLEIPKLFVSANKTPEEPSVSVRLEPKFHHVLFPFLLKRFDIVAFEDLFQCFVAAGVVDGVLAERMVVVD